GDEIVFEKLIQNFQELATGTHGVDAKPGTQILQASLAQIQPPVQIGRIITGVGRAHDAAAGKTHRQWITARRIPKTHRVNVADNYSGDVRLDDCAGEGRTRSAGQSQQTSRARVRNGAAD